MRKMQKKKTKKNPVNACLDPFRLSLYEGKKGQNRLKKTWYTQFYSFKPISRYGHDNFYLLYYDQQRINIYSATLLLVSLFLS